MCGVCGVCMTRPERASIRVFFLVMDGGIGERVYSRLGGSLWMLRVWVHAHELLANPHLLTKKLKKGVGKCVFFWESKK